MQLWESLATLGAAGLTATRVIEPHLDALAILDQAGQAGVAPKDSTWGVFAARGPGRQLLATPVQEGWRLDGDKPWCSLADDLSHALLTARTDAGVQLFAIDLRHPGVTTAGRRWSAMGLPSAPSRGLLLADVAAMPVGGPGWCTQRPGFSWGGVGVAAIWHGAATALARRLHRHCLSREPDQIALSHFGSADQALWSSRSSFQSAAAVADLELYLRQDHAERSLAAHGMAVLEAADAGGGAPPWLLSPTIRKPLPKRSGWAAPASRACPH